MCLSVKDFSVYFNDKPILRDINAEFERGFNLIVGESGGGKTSFLKAICHLLDFKGQVLFEGKPVDREWVRKNCAMIKQSGFYTSNTIIETVKMPFCFKSHRDKQFNKNSFQKLVKLFKLDKFKGNDKIKKLSGGELQRLAIIRAVLLEPIVLLADEPTSNLDADVSKVVYQYLKEYCKNRICIIVSHDPIAEDYADRLYRLEKGVLYG